VTKLQIKTNSLLVVNLQRYGMVGREGVLDRTRSLTSIAPELYTHVDCLMPQVDISFM